MLLESKCVVELMRLYQALTKKYEGLPIEVTGSMDLMPIDNLPLQMGVMPSGPLCWTFRL